MSMIKYSLKMLKRNFLINFFIAAQIGITLILTIICVSSVMSKIGDYLPIKDILNSDGMCLFALGDYIESQDGPVYYTVRDIENASENIEKVYSNETIDFLYELRFCVPIILFNILLPVLLTQVIISRQSPRELLTEE